MKLFPYGHATHPQWRMAAGLVLAQLRAQMALHGYANAPTLALLYITDHYAPQAQEILAHLSGELGMMAAQGRDFLFMAPHIATIPSLAIFAIVLAANLLGDAVRDVLDPRLQQ